MQNKDNFLNHSKYMSVIVYTLEFIFNLHAFNLLTRYVLGMSR